MNDILESVRRRRSVRRYRAEPIAPDVVAQLEEAVLRSPSSRGIRPWRFVFVTDREALRRLSEAKPRYAGFLADAALGVVVCADEPASDAWVEDCSAAAATLMLAAASLGLGSCWVQIRMREHAEGRSAESYVREVLGLPEELRVECIVSLGHPAEESAPVERERLKWDAIARV